MLQKFLDAVTDGDLSMMRSFESLRSGCDDFGTRDYVAAVVDRLLFAVNRPQRHQLPLLAIGPVTRLPGANRITDGMRLVFDEVALANDRVYRLAQVWCDREVLLHRVGEREGPHCAVTNRGSSFKRLGLDEDEYQAVVARRFGAERISVPAMKRRIAQTLNASNTPDAATA